MFHDAVDVLVDLFKPPISFDGVALPGRCVSSEVDKGYML
jgi:hypothetical protein